MLFVPVLPLVYILGGGGGGDGGGGKRWAKSRKGCFSSAVRTVQRLLKSSDDIVLFILSDCHWYTCLVTIKFVTKTYRKHINWIKNTRLRLVEFSFVRVFRNPKRIGDINKRWENTPVSVQGSSNNKLLIAAEEVSDVPIPRYLTVSHRAYCKATLPRYTSVLPRVMTSEPAVLHL